MILHVPVRTFCVICMCNEGNNDLT